LFAPREWQDLATVATRKGGAAESSTFRSRILIDTIVRSAISGCRARLSSGRGTLYGSGTGGEFRNGAAVRVEDQAPTSGASTRSWMRNETVSIALICAVALVHGLVLGAAFPLFNNVDEQAHFDLVRKYARLHIPAPGADQFDRESAELIVLYGSPEFLEDYRDRPVPAPLWSLSGPKVERHVQRMVSRWSAATNYEAHAPPLYYAAAALWLRAGQAMGIAGGYQGYWIRLFDAPLWIALILLAYSCCSLLRPEDRTLRLGVPLLLASMPQDAYHAINSDLAAALSGTLVLHACARIAVGGATRGRFVWAGLCVAGAVMVKLSNLPLLAVFAMFALWLAADARSAFPRGLASSRNVGWMAGAAALPLALWIVWNAVVYGDALGVASKIDALGWTTKSFPALLDHPILTPAGFWTWSSGLIASFWRGEYVWGGERIAWAPLDTLLVLLTILCWGAAAVGRRMAPQPPSAAPVITGWGYALTIVLFFAFQAVLSMRYDFGESWYPSREEPFFVSGRLMLGAVVPMLAVFVEGLDRLLATFRERVSTLAVLVAFAFVLVCAEMWLGRAAFASAYNFFHLS